MILDRSSHEPAGLGMSPCVVRAKEWYSSIPSHGFPNGGLNCLSTPMAVIAGIYGRNVDFGVEPGRHWARVCAEHVRNARFPHNSEEAKTWDE